MAYWYVDKHQRYIGLIKNEPLRKLVEACLQRDFKNRPSMLQVSERITSIMTGEFKEAIIL